jgi:hypothetical protein
MMQDNFPLKRFKCSAKDCGGTVEVKGAGVQVAFSPCDEHQGFPCSKCGKLHLPNGTRLFDQYSNRGDAFLIDGKVVLVKDGKVVKVVEERDDKVNSGHNSFYYVLMTILLFFAVLFFLGILIFSE